jgi:hypothetical protein
MVESMGTLSRYGQKTSLENGHEAGQASHQLVRYLISVVEILSISQECKFSYPNELPIAQGM